MSIQPIRSHAFSSFFGTQITPAIQKRFCFSLSQNIVFPNPFYHSPKKSIEKTFANLLKKIDILYLDPKTNECKNSGFFEEIENIVKSQDLNAKTYLSGGSIRSLFSFLYEEILYAVKYKKESPEEILQKMESNTFTFKNSPYALRMPLEG